MNWRGIIGKGFTPAEFGEYVATLSFPTWRPLFCVLHNTGAPRLDQWHECPGAQRMLNLQSFYRDERGWSAGPHLFVADDLIWVFTPLTVPGVHSPSWNHVSWGIEQVGDFDVESYDTGAGARVRDNSLAALATLHAKLGLDSHTLKFHKMDPLTTHKDCPGKGCVYDDVVSRLHAALEALRC